jgi:hypothetical protein
MIRFFYTLDPSKIGRRSLPGFMGQAAWSLKSTGSVTSLVKLPAGNAAPPYPR